MGEPRDPDAWNDPEPVPETDLPTFDEDEIEAAYWRQQMEHSL